MYSTKEIKNGVSVSEISLKYGVDISYVFQFKDKIGETGNGN